MPRNASVLGLATFRGFSTFNLQRQRTLPQKGARRLFQNRVTPRYRDSGKPLVEFKRTKSAPWPRKSHSGEWRFRAKSLVRKGGLEPPPAKADKILSPEVSLLTTVVYNTEQHSTTRSEETYKQPGSPRSVVCCCRILAFVEFKCTRSALLGVPDSPRRCTQWGKPHLLNRPSHNSHKNSPFWCGFRPRAPRYAGTILVRTQDHRRCRASQWRAYPLGFGRPGPQPRRPRSPPKLGTAHQACLRSEPAPVPVMWWRDANHSVHHRPRCRGRDSEAPHEGRGAVPSRPTESCSPLRRFLSLMSAAAACAGCAPGGGSETCDRGSRVIVLGGSAPVGGA